MDVASAWRTSAEWRDDYVFWTARGVSKHGGIGQDEVMLELGRTLTRDEALWFYGQIRDQSRRSEGEWRAEFLWVLKQVALPDLPPLPQGEQVDEYPPPEPPAPKGDLPPVIEIPF